VTNAYKKVTQEQCSKKNRSNVVKKFRKVSEKATQGQV